MALTRVRNNDLAFDGGQLGGFRNKIINGAMNISQRATSFSNPATGAYTLDRWRVDYDGTSGTFVIQQNNSGPNADSFKELYWNQTVAPTGSTYKNIQQRIEGVSTLAGKQVTVSFLASSVTNVSSVSVGVVQSFGSGGTPSTSVTTTFGTINLTGGVVRTQYSITATIPSVAGKTLGSNGDDFLALYITLPINAVFGFTITNVQLEQGSVATPFETRSIGQELASCQRYYNANVILGFRFAAPIASTTFEQRYVIPTLRTTPTVIAGTIISQSNVASFSNQAVDSSNLLKLINSTNGANTDTFHNQYVSLSAEL